MLLKLKNESKFSHHILPYERTTKALGMNWNLKLDVFIFKNVYEECNGISKRSIYATISETYDRLWFLTPLAPKRKATHTTLVLED